MEMKVLKENSKEIIAVEQKLSRRNFINKLAGLGGLSVLAGVTLTSCINDDWGGSSVYAIDANRCTGCTDCFAGCQFSAISLTGEIAVISSSRCAGCGKCVRYCDEGAISRG